MKQTCADLQWHRPSRLSLAMIISVLMLLLQSSLILAQKDEEEDTTNVNVSVTCDDGDQCTLTFQSDDDDFNGGGLEVNFKQSAGSCQAAFDGLTAGINFPDGVTASYSLTCSGGSSGSSGSSGTQAASGQSGSDTAPPEHNCCFVDRQCTTDQEWHDGYYAYQNGQCAASPQTQTQSSTPDSTGASTPANNCCGINRQCATEQEWDAGYYAYQNGQCAALS